MKNIQSVNFVHANLEITPIACWKFEFGKPRYTGYKKPKSSQWQRIIIYTNTLIEHYDLIVSKTVLWVQANMKNFVFMDM